MHFQRSLAAPQKGDIKMLVSHALARLEHRLGNSDAAKAACKEVLEPTLYQAYRAVLMPDCTAWGGSATQRETLVRAWRGATFVHPAVKLPN
jgi:hypothetical protein